MKTFRVLGLISALQVLIFVAPVNASSLNCIAIFHPSRVRDIRTFAYYERWLIRNHNTRTVKETGMSVEASFDRENRLVRISDALVSPAAERFVILHESVHSKTDVDLTNEPSLIHAARAIQIVGVGDLNLSLPLGVRNDPSAPRVPGGYIREYVIDEVHAWEKESAAYAREIQKSEVTGRPDLEILKLRYAVRRDTALQLRRVTPIILNEALTAIQKLRDGSADMSAATLVDQFPYVNRSDVAVLKFGLMMFEGRRGFSIQIPVHVPGESVASPTPDQRLVRIKRALATIELAIKSL